MSLPSSRPQDDILPAILSRLAALQGRAVPKHRFEMMSHTHDGMPTDELPMARRAVEYWRTTFPSSENQVLELPVNQIDLPVLWVQEFKTDCALPQALIVKGVLAGGSLSCTCFDGEHLELSIADAQKGLLLSLMANPKEDDERAIYKKHQAPKTAKDWFRYAIIKRKRVFIEAAIATATVNTLVLGTSFFTMQVYDRVIPTQGYSTLWVLAVGVFIAIMLELLMRYMRTRIVERGCSAIDMELSSVFFNHALGIRMDQRPPTVGTFAAQIRHFESVRNFMTSSTLFGLADAPFAIVFVLVIALIAGPVAIIPAVFLFIAVFLGLVFKRPIAKLAEANMKESNHKNGLIIEAIDGIESIKANNAEWKVLHNWNALTKLLAKDNVSMKSLTGMASYTTQSMQQLSYVGIVCAGAFAIGTGNLTVGGLIATTIISGRALSPMTRLSGLIVQWQHAKIALKGLDAIMEMPSDLDISQFRPVVPDSCKGQLRLDRLKFGYSEDAFVISVNKLTINAGEKVAILGPIGSGKSTLVKILSGLYKPTEGRVLLDDIDMFQLATAFVREYVGYLPQDVRLFQGTLRDNLALGLPSPTDDQIFTAAKKTGLDKVITEHPKGLGLEISEGGRGLSGGQRQLVGLTRLVLARHTVMLLDEPTASMDPQLEDQIAKNVFGPNPDHHTLVVVTHKIPLLKYFDRVIIFNRGQVVMDGPRDQILERLQTGTAKMKAERRE